MARDRFTGAMSERSGTDERVMAIVDAALEELTSAEPSAHFASRVRAHVEHAPRRWTPASWWIPATVAALALLTAAIVVGRLPREPIADRQASANRPVERTAVPPVERAADRTTAGEKPAIGRTARARRRPVPEPVRLAQTPEVLVPGQQREAVSRLVASLRAGRPDVISMLMGLHEGEAGIDGRGVTIEPLHIEPVVVSALPSSATLFDK